MESSSFVLINFWSTNNGSRDSYNRHHKTKTTTPSSTMLFKNIAILSLAAFVVANEAAAPVVDNAPVANDEHSGENPEDIHKLKDHIHSKKCPKPSCQLSTTTVTTNFHTSWATVFETVQKQCAPTQAPVKKTRTKKTSSIKTSSKTYYSKTPSKTPSSKNPSKGQSGKNY